MLQNLRDRRFFVSKGPRSFGTTIGDLWDICGLSVAVLGRSFNHSQVDCGLRDHFATTVAHLSPSCITAVALCFHLFVFHMPLYIIGVLNTQRFSGLVLEIADFSG